MGFLRGPVQGLLPRIVRVQGFLGRQADPFLQEPKAMPFFKAFKTALEESNRGFKFDETNPGCIVGKVMGIVLAEEEYIGNDGKMKIRTYVDKTHSVRAIQAGDFKVPELKKLAGSAAAASASAGNQFAELPENEEELPF
jgi:hypothetical protein